MNVAGLPSPAELGFPAKFQDWYADQIVAIDKAVLSNRRFTALVMPTGSGKSVTGIATAMLMSAMGVKRALYLTRNKGLQDQLAADLLELGLHDVRGQKNYPCRATEPGGELDRYRRGRLHLGCDEGPCHSGVPCSLAPDKNNPGFRPGCEYYGRVWDARRRDLVSSNYAMWLTASAYSEGLGSFDLLILDEAHDADKELEAFLEIEITLDDLKFLDTKKARLLPTNDMAVWKDFATMHVEGLRRRVELMRQIQGLSPEDVKDLSAMRITLGKLDRLRKINPMDWVGDVNPMSARMAPIKVAAYAEECLFRHVPHVLLMSATMTRKTAALLGIPDGELTYWECPSRFPVERRPIISVNTHPPVRVNHRMSDDDKYMWLRRVDRLIDGCAALGWKGIIHTVSYQRAKELLAHSDHRKAMIVHDTAGTREAIRQFKCATEPVILVSPSIITGYDFPDDQCRYQIIGKVPLPDTRGAIMTIRKDLDPDYVGYLAMQKLVQACGRPIRNPRDWAVTYIVDDVFRDWFLKKNKKFAPRYFLEAVEFVDTYPDPVEWAAGF